MRGLASGMIDSTFLDSFQGTAYRAAMKAIDRPEPTAVRLLEGEGALAPPRWVREIFALAPARSAPAVSVAKSERGSFISVRVPAAIRLGSEAFERAATSAYGTIRQQLKGLHPVRFWNHIPAIHAVMDAERDRYMVFNAGRFGAFENWYGSRRAFSSEVATASGVGHAGEDLVIHCLAVGQPGAAVENPRQIASYRYSRRYGPVPPCFARATTIRLPGDERRLLLVGGTASIRGEDSVHLRRLDRQIEETFENLSALVTACRSEDQREQALSRYRYLRVYYRRREDLEEIRQTVAQCFNSLLHVDFIQAELCRQELLVEIEGVAEL
jgi:hypothetical protein